MEDIIKHAKIYFTTLWYMEVVFLKSSFKVKRKTSKYIAYIGKNGMLQGETELRLPLLLL